ncbi:MAG: NMD3-related protein [Candidatus Thorarchaeota archaeon]
MPNRFCAICGKEINEKDPHYGMCLKCYLKENPLFEVPNSFSLNICLDCGSYSKKDKWIESEENKLEFIIKQAILKFLLKNYTKKNIIEFNISLKEESYTFSAKDLLVSLEAVIHGNLKEDLTIEHKQSIQVNLSYILCKNCSNLRGGTFYLSIIQLRVKKQDQFDLIKKVLDEINDFVEQQFEKDQKHYISKIEDQKYGVDLYLSTIELMNYLVSFLKSKYNFLLKRTKKLVGRDNQRGKNLYRFKTLIKFLPVRINDLISINNQNYIVENMTKNKVILRGENNTKLIKDYSYFFNERIIKKNNRG